MVRIILENNRKYQPILFLHKHSFILSVRMNMKTSFFANLKNHSVSIVWSGRIYISKSFER